MTDLYLSLGSNLGDRHERMLLAIEHLVHEVGPLVRCSSLIETEPWGFQSEHRFLNAVALFHTTLSPRQVLTATQGIERALGRKQKTAPAEKADTNGERKELPDYKDRTIDIDILLYDDLRIEEPDLKIPHPLMQERDFVMRPFLELKGLLSEEEQHKSAKR